MAWTSPVGKEMEKIKQTQAINSVLPPASSITSFH